MELWRQELSTAARVHGEVNFAHGAAQARAMRFQRLVWSTDDDDAATQVTTQDSRWRAGVNWQAEAQQEAQQHQVAASRAAAAKRKESAMSYHV